MKTATATGRVEYPPLLVVPGHDPNPPYGCRPINQPQYDYVTAEEENVFLLGDRGGGKSVIGRWNFHTLAMSYPGYRYAILRTSYPELIKNHLIYMGAEMEALGGEWNATDKIAKYPNKSFGFYMQCETEEQARNALGVEMMAVLYDEAPTFNWDHITMINSSVRVPAEMGLIPLKRYNGNPIGPCINELWKYFHVDDTADEVDLVEDPGYDPARWRVIRISHRQNTKLDIEAYRRGLGVGLPEAIRRAWLDGERIDTRTLFVLRPTIVVPKTDPVTREETQVEQRYHVIEEMPKAQNERGESADILTLPWVRIQGCYDDGYIDPAVMLWTALVGNQIIVFNERVWMHTNSPDIAKGILDASVITLEDGTEYQLPLKRIYADPVISKETTAVQSTMDVMQSVWKCMKHPNHDSRKRCCERARALMFEPSTNSRELYATAINRVLQAEVGLNTPKMVFLKPNPNSEVGHSLITRGITGCPYLIKMLPKMQFDENDPRKMADHKHDHPVVALAYHCLSFPITTSAPTLDQTRPPWWNDFFIGNSNVPKKQYTPKRRR